MTQSPLISEADACAWLGVDLRALRRMVRAGLLKRGTFGCYNRQDVMSLAEAIAATLSPNAGEMGPDEQEMGGQLMANRRPLAPAYTVDGSLDVSAAD